MATIHKRVILSWTLLLQSLVAVAQTSQYTEDFDEIATPALPGGWISPDSSWQTSISVASPISGRNNVENRGSAPGTLVSPVFDFSSVTSAELRYWARRTSTYDSLNLQIEASTDGGLEWTVVVLDSTASLPLTPSEYDELSVALPNILHGREAVRLRFRSLRSTGGNLRLDDVVILTEGILEWNRMGFSSPFSVGLENSNSLQIPLSLHLIPSSMQLQGLQFTIALSSGILFQSLETVLPALESPEWHLSYEVASDTIKAVLLAEGSAGLSHQSTDTLLALFLGLAPLGSEESREDTLEIGNAIASAASSTGEELSLSIENRVHRIMVVQMTPLLSFEPSVVDLGAIALDSTAEAEITVTNEGTEPLEISDMFSISGHLGIEPSFLTIAPDSSTGVVVTVKGADYGLGAFEDWLILDHNAATSPDTVTITGVVVNGRTRGDANGDGLVDVVDLVLGIDFILGRTDLDGRAVRLDLHPFPSGDGEIDVRDLTVLAQAIAGGRWPDEEFLPEAPSILEKVESIVGDLIVDDTPDGVRLRVRSAEPLRALHVVARASGLAGVRVSPDLPAAHVGQPYGSLGDGSFSILAFGLEEAPVPTTEPVIIARLEGSLTADRLRIIGAHAVDMALRRRSLLAIVESKVASSNSEPEGFGPPYPNPVNPNMTALVHLPILSSDDRRVKISVTDVLGRLVRQWSEMVDAGRRVAAWDLKNSSGSVVVPGIYFLTLAGTSGARTHPLVVR